MTKADRQRVQDALQRLGYYKGGADCVFGRLTREAVRGSQSGLPVRSCFVVGSTASCMIYLIHEQMPDREADSRHRSILAKNTWSFRL